MHYTRYGEWLYRLEWGFTLLFTVEYMVRIYVSPRPLKYVTSFYGVVDLMSIIPTYLAVFLAGTNYLLIIRLLRVLRVFRVLKLMRYSEEARLLFRALASARRKITIFFAVVMVLATVFGSLMFVVEGPEHGFTSIPRSIYWTIVTITTVGYGDITPETVVGQLVSTMAMLIGYSIIAIPTGIVSAELIQEGWRNRDPAEVGIRTCAACGTEGHRGDANYCRDCGAALSAPEAEGGDDAAQSPRTPPSS